jgi:hypothetical protein
MTGKPVPDSYWVQAGRFLAGAYPGLSYDEQGTRQRLASLLAAGFDTFIDLTCDGDRPAYLPLLQDEAARHGMKVQHRRFSFPDYGIPAHAAMTSALDAIDAALDEGRHVYLHCVGGIGRTGTTVACWLIRHGMQPPAALQHLQQIYATSEQSQFSPHSPESDQQVRFILEWNEHGLA